MSRAKRPTSPAPAQPDTAKTATARRRPRVNVTRPRVGDDLAGREHVDDVTTPRVGDTR